MTDIFNTLRIWLGRHEKKTCIKELKDNLGDPEFGYIDEENPFKGRTFIWIKTVLSPKMKNIRDGQFLKATLDPMDGGKCSLHIEVIYDPENKRIANEGKKFAKARDKNLYLSFTENGFNCEP